MRWSWVLVLIGLAACTPAAEPPPPTTTSTSPTSTTSSPPPLEVPPCLAGDAPFVESGSAAPTRRAGGDASTLREISWDVFAGCERLAVAFGSEAGAPAVVAPAVSALLDRSTGVLRMTLPPEVDRSVIATQLVDTDLVGRLFVVATADGTLALDVHLVAPALARIQAASAPSRVTLDLVPGGSRFGSPPLVADDLVVLAPTGGSVAYPFTVTGYSRGELGTVTVSAPAGAQEATTTVAEADGGWSAFVALFPDGPTGPVVLRVGDLIVDLVITG
jgi:hypothetical protein